MKTIRFKATIFSTERERRFSEGILRILLDTLVRINLKYLKQHPNTPSLYSSGVRYQREDGTEDWLDIGEVLKLGHGDCEDLACYRVAELIKSGINARPELVWQNKGKFYLYHIKVFYNGKLEDPSRQLGMR
jgi:hypothetical protein